MTARARTLAIAAGAALFALDNVIYRMVRERPQ
jgi:hypothetical protein